MRYSTSASTSFDVGHATPVPAACERPHGHRATITVGLAGKPQAEYGSFVGDVDALLRELAAIEYELKYRDLGEMTAPAKPTAAGLAGWVWERLALNWGEALEYVEVWLGALSARIER